MTPDEADALEQHALQQARASMDSLVRAALQYGYAAHVLEVVEGAFDPGPDLEQGQTVECLRCELLAHSGVLARVSVVREQVSDGLWQARMQIDRITH